MEDNVILCALNFHYTCAGLLKQGISTEGCAGEKLSRIR
jgi:hypothetical protein